jgi:hypothetical protein
MVYLKSIVAILNTGFFRLILSLTTFVYKSVVGIFECMNPDNYQEKRHLFPDA